MSFEDKAGLIELAIFYSIAIGFCVWQLVSVRRLMRRDKEAANAAASDNPGTAPPDRPDPVTKHPRETRADTQHPPVTQD
ncbi:MAG TPA: hypothetical protein PK970_12515 [Hyphomicrobiaceae bacterium]|nr:hypothetical protein [Hyphomicrobiaceae bacterium]